MVFYPEMGGEGGGGGGLEVKTATAIFEAVAASSSAFADLVLEGNRISILGAKTTQDGASTMFRLRAYSEGTYSNDVQEIFGSGFSGVSYSGSPVYGPAVSSGGSTQKPALHYIDLDEGNELHLQLDNEDVTNAGTFTVEFKYLILE